VTSESWPVLTNRVRRLFISRRHSAEFCGGTVVVVEHHRVGIRERQPPSYFGGILMTGRRLVFVHRLTAAVSTPELRQTCHRQTIASLRGIREYKSTQVYDAIHPNHLMEAARPASFDDFLLFYVENCPRRPASKSSSDSIAHG
jgi:hypothetical protein